jgi:hypothetical protein
MIMCVFIAELFSPVVNLQPCSLGDDPLTF